MRVLGINPTSKFRFYRLRDPAKREDSRVRVKCLKNVWRKGEFIRDEKGVALILVLVVIALLVSLVVDFTYTMQVDVTLAANQRDEVKAFYVARSGMELARLMLKEDDPAYDARDEDWALFDEHPGFIDEDDEGRFNGTIEDEASKFPINDLIDEKGVIDEGSRRQLERLFEVLDLDPDLVDPICDWLDRDSNAGPTGAEDAYYAELSPPYPCKDGPLSSLEELLLVKGMTEEILYGDAEKKGLLQYLTIHSDDKININTASAEVLQSLSDYIDENLAQAIIDYRQEEPFKVIKYDDIKHLPGMTLDIFNEIHDHCDVKSSTFSIRIEGEVRGIKKGIYTVVKRKGKAVEPVFWRME
jgi:general secretion pathway protein K